MGDIVLVAKWCLRYMKGAWRIIVRNGFALTGIWESLKTLFAMSGTLMFIGLEPSLEVLIQALTGWKGPVSWFIQNMLTKGLNYVTAHLTGVNVQASIDQLSASQPHLMQYCCYIGLTAALQILFDGIINGMATILSIEITVLSFKIMTSLFLRMV